MCSARGSQSHNYRKSRHECASCSMPAHLGSDVNRHTTRIIGVIKESLVKPSRSPFEYAALSNFCNQTQPGLASTSKNVAVLREEGVLYMRETSLSVGRAIMHLRPINDLETKIGKWSVMKSTYAISTQLIYHVR